MAYLVTIFPFCPKLPSVCDSYQRIRLIENGLNIRISFNYKQMMVNRLHPFLPNTMGWIGFWQTLLLLGAELGGMFLIVYRVSWWLFFKHLEHSDPLTLEDVLPKPGEEWKSLILVGTRSISREPIRRRGKEVHIIDMISQETGPDGAPMYLLENKPEETKAVCLDYFDHRLDEAKWNRYMLEFLEKNIFSGHSMPLILITSRDLNEVLISGESNVDQPDENERRWDRVLGQFTKVILSDVTDPYPFELSLQLRVVHKLTEDLNDLSKEIAKSYKIEELHSNTSQIKRSIEESAVKVKWLREELKKLNNNLYTVSKINKEKRLGSELNFQSFELQNKVEIISVLLVGTVDEIKKTKDKFEGDDKFPNSLNSIVDSMKEAGKIIAVINERILGNNKSSAEEIDTQRSGLMFLIRLLQQTFRNLTMWMIPSSHMNAERTVYREKKNIKDVYHILLKECGRHERLQEIGKQILSRPKWYELKSAEVIDLIREGANTYYAARWAILSESERLVAAQLARGSVVNPNSEQAVNRLIARGLIKTSPDLRLDNKSFAQFVNNTVSGDTLNEWEHSGIPSTWESVRGPFIIALVIIVLFLFWTQREFLGSTITFLGTVGVGMGAILNLLSKFNRSSGTAETKSSS